MAIKLIEQTQPTAVASRGQSYVDSSTGALHFRESTGFGSDDYPISPEIGTWTPAFAGSGTAGTFTYTAATAAYYTKIGNLVWFGGRVTISAISVAPTTNMRITGLPFTAKSDTVNSGAITFGFISNLDFSANAIQLTGVVVGGQSYIDLYEVFDNAAAVAYPAANFTNAACSIIFSGWYRY